MTRQKNSLQNAINRHKALKVFRKYFENAAFLEVDGNYLVKEAAIEANIEPFRVEFTSAFTNKKLSRYLITSPELNLKAMLASGAPRVYQIASVFRDGELTERHLPEFTLIEWYRSHEPLEALILDCESLFKMLCRKLVGSEKIPATESRLEIDLSKSFERLSVCEAWQKLVGVDLNGVLLRINSGEQDALQKELETRNFPVGHINDFEDAFYYIMANYIEPQIGHSRPCVIYDWPAQFAALAKKSEENPLYASRFEIYAGGLELANAYDELTDAREQSARFVAELSRRSTNNRMDLPYPEEFINALRYMPKSAGIALGLERLLMLLCGKDLISDVQVFPSIWL